MNKVFITGDKHRSFSDLFGFCERFQTDRNDWMIVLGDNGVNWYGDERDEEYKEYLSRIPIRFMMIRGNHDMRPEDAVQYVDGKIPIAKYKPIFVNNPAITGYFLRQDEFPNLYFAKDGGTYKIGKDTTAFVIGGAYSIDKAFRIRNNIQWFENEQLDAKERVTIGHKFKNFVDMKSTGQTNKLLVFSHTCPLRFVPLDAKKLTVIKSDTEDFTMEHWMDQLYEGSHDMIDTWYCGHWHVNKVDSPMIFMFEDVREIEYEPRKWPYDTNEIIYSSK